MIATALAATFALSAPTGFEDPADWPGFRGPGAMGIAEGFPLPTKWDVESGENVRWSTPIPGLAHSSPVVSGDRLFVTSAVKVEGDAKLSSLYGSKGYGDGTSVPDEGAHEFRVYCLDKRTGKILWDKKAHTGVPAVKRHPKATHASSTPACNSKYVVAFFGSEGLYCFDHDGELVWQKSFGVLDAGAPGMRQYQWGFASSPTIDGEHVIVQCDVQDQSFLAVLKLADGEEVWRTLRDEDPTWSTPSVVESGADGRRQIVCNGYKHIGAYDFETGKEVWKLVGGGDVPVPTPLVSDELTYITNAHGRMRPIYAIKNTAKGELSIDPDDCEHMAWSYPRKGIYMQTPLLYGGLLYCCSDGGILGCYDAQTGEEVYRERLGSGKAGFSGSAVASDGRLFFSSENGEVHVVEAGVEFQVLAVNDMGETLMATPAISEGALFFRTRRNVVAVGFE